LKKFGERISLIRDSFPMKTGMKIKMIEEMKKYGAKALKKAFRPMGHLPVQF
jgi:hypothetical protein